MQRKNKRVHLLQERNNHWLHNQIINRRNTLACTAPLEEFVINLWQGMLTLQDGPGSATFNSCF